ncbi:MAG: S8 family serine peptidase [Pseudomonadales bacterium]|nr:S8 family serine peptidase [Pseudomonadales bacterium]
MKLLLIAITVLSVPVYAQELAQSWQEPVTISMPAPTRSVVLHESVTIATWIETSAVTNYRVSKAGRRNSLVQFQMTDQQWNEGAQICGAPGVISCESAVCQLIQVDSTVDGLNGEGSVKARIVKKRPETPPDEEDPDTGAGMCEIPVAAAPFASSGQEALAADISLDLELIQKTGADKRKQRRRALKRHGEFRLNVSDTYQGTASFSAERLPADTTDYDLVVSEGCREVRIPLESVEPAHVPGVVLTAMASADVASVSAEYQLTIVSQAELKSSSETLVLFAADDILRVLGLLALDSRVIAAQKEYIYTTAAGMHTDPFAAMAYGPKESGALYLHDTTQGASQTIAIIDTGVATEHPELQGRVAAEDFTDEGFTPDAHGTAVAAIIAAAADNSQGAYGVAPAAQLLALKACHPVDGGLRAKCRTSAVVKALDAAINNDAQIINMSIAGPPDLMVQRYVSLATRQNRLVVAGAGNGGVNAKPAFPAALPDVLAVTAIDVQGKLYRDANQGNYVDLAAPGVDIVTTAPDGKSYPWTSGTSWAAAHVSGVAALMRDLIPFAGGQEVASILTSQADDLGEVGTDTKFGSGAVNACKAVEAGTASAVQCEQEEPETELFGETQ